MGLQQVIISMILIGLFTIAIVGFAINFASDNSSSISVSDDPEMSSMYSNANSNISEFGNKNAGAQKQYDSILNTTIAPGSSEPQSAAPFAITPTSAFGVVKSIIYLPYQKVFGTGKGFGVFFTTFITILVFVVGLLIYKALRGIPD